MIARDEEGDIARCLDSVVGVADEIVVVDTGSMDRTREIAAAHGARVVRYAWGDDFSAARNAALDAARGQWILVLDADEAVDGTGWATVRGLVADATWDAARVRVRNMHAPDDLCAFSESRLTRLFRNRPPYRYAGIVHEQISPAIVGAGGTIGDVDLRIVHYGYMRRTAQGTDGRCARNLRLLERALAKTPEDPYLHYQYGAALKMAGASGPARQALERALGAGADGLDGEALDLIHTKLAQLAVEDGRLADAVSHARASLAIQPDNLLSLLALGVASLLAGDVDGAYPAFLQARGVADGRMRDTTRLDALLTYCQHHAGAGR